MIYTYKKGNSNAVDIFNDGFPVAAVLNGYQTSPHSKSDFCKI